MSDRTARRQTNIDTNGSNNSAVVCESCGSEVLPTNLTSHEAVCQGPPRVVAGGSVESDAMDIDDECEIIERNNRRSATSVRRRWLQTRPNVRSLRPHPTSSRTTPSQRNLPRPSWDRRQADPPAFFGSLNTSDPSENISTEILDLRTPEDDRKPSRRRDDTTISDFPSISHNSDEPQTQDVVNLLDDSNETIVNEDEPIQRTYRNHERTSADGDVVTDPVDTEWACPRCTLLNSIVHPHCSACGCRNRLRRSVRSLNENSRFSDSIQTGGRFSRDPDLMVQNEGSGEDDDLNRRVLGSPFTYMGGGAILGGVLGTTGALFNGRPLMSAAMEGAVTGAVGGVLMREVLEPSQPARAATLESNSTSERRRSRNARQPHRSRDTGAIVRNNSRRATAGANTDNARRIVRHVEGFPDDGMLDFFLMAMMGPDAIRTRNIDSMSYEQLLQAFGDGTENMGTSEEFLSSLPVAKVNDPEKDLPEDHRQCLICLEEFQAGEERMTLPCLHGFHDNCATKWLLSNGSCPICKHQVNDDGSVENFSKTSMI